MMVVFPISGKTIIREPGDILNEKRFNREVLEGLKKSMGSAQFAGQMQQSPAPAEGIIFKREWLHEFYSVPPRTTDIQSWDMLLCSL